MLSIKKIESEFIDLISTKHGLEKLILISLSSRKTYREHRAIYSIYKENDCLPCEEKYLDILNMLFSDVDVILGEALSNRSRDYSSTLFEFDFISQKKEVQKIDLFDEFESFYVTIIRRIINNDISILSCPVITNSTAYSELLISRMIKEDDADSISSFVNSNSDLFYLYNTIRLINHGKVFKDMMLSIKNLNPSTKSEVLCKIEEDKIKRIILEGDLML